LLTLTEKYRDSSNARGLYMPINQKLVKRCIYNTSRLEVKRWQPDTSDASSKDQLIMSVINLLTPQVTQYLPDGWQNIKTFEDANLWVTQICEESSFFIVTLRETNEIIGFLFLYELELQNNYSDLKFGYLLSETTWGKGLGTELIAGLIRWAENDRTISSISGGVSNKNIGSIRVLEKNGFIALNLPNDTKDNITYEYKFNCK